MQQQHKVIKQFEDQIDLYTDLAKPESSTVPFLVTPFLLDWLKNNPAFLAQRVPLKICEFGGGGGIILDLLQKQLNHPVFLVNAELVHGYGERQIAPNILFVQTSILEAGLADNIFDVVMARNVLHHLIGDSLQQSRRNQQFVFEELLRVTKPGGLIVIQEQVNQRGWAANLIYYMSRFASLLKLDIESFEITPNTVIAYMTHEQLGEYMAAKIPHKQWLVNAYTRRPMPLRWRLTVLMSNNGDVLMVAQKPELS